MKTLSLLFNTEIQEITKERRKRIVAIVYAIVFFIFFAHNITDIFHQSYQTVPMRTAMILLLICSYFLFYQRAKYDYASYAVIFILTVGTLNIVYIHHFDNYTTGFIYPVVLAAFSIFSWRKGFLLSIAILAIIGLPLLYYPDIFDQSLFLHEPIAISNFFFIFIIILLFAIYYEKTRIDAYIQLINANYTKDLLYNELQHRVKNNLNIVSSILAIQAEKEDQKVKDIIQITKSRIDAMAMVHSMLYVSRNLEKIDAKHFIEKLYHYIQSTLNGHVNIIFKTQNIQLSISEIIPIGLIINELVINSFKYAFHNGKNPKIIIVLKYRRNKVLLTYFDNGIGYDVTMKKNFGLRLVDLNVKQLKGVLKVFYNYGLCYQITYKKSSHSARKK